MTADPDPTASAGMAIFDRLPPAIREVLNYSAGTVSTAALHCVEALVAHYGESAVLQTLRAKANKVPPP